MAERVRVQPGHASLVGAAYQDLPDAGIGERAAGSEPQVGAARIFVFRPHPEYRSNEATAL
jgi:hypothetical protein